MQSLDKKSENLLVIFAKNPNTQKVKTRLAKAIGESSATFLYTSWLSQFTSSLSKSNHYDTKIYIQGGNKGLDFSSCEQKGKDLGEKMYNAFKKELISYQRMVIIGSDIAGINSPFIENVFKQMTKEDEIILGPSPDGGYYLIGQRKPQNIFQNISWSTSSVFEKTVEQITKKGLTLKVLEEKRDLDTFEDLCYFCLKGMKNG